MIDSRTLERAKEQSIETVASGYGLKLRGRIEREGPCPMCGGTDRFSINTKKQVWNCRGCEKGGDVIALVQFVSGFSFREAVAILAGEQTGNHKPAQCVPKPDVSCTDNYENRQRDKARYLWRTAQPPSGTPVEAYLRRRLNGNTTLPATIRYLPPLRPEHRPAMIVPYGLRKITAVQLTLLKPDGSGKAETKPNKITIASPSDMPMVIAPPNDLLGLAITEGVEDALSVHCATGLGAWASGGASNMPKLAAAVPNFIEAVTIYAHTDATGLRGAYELASALDERGIETRIESSPAPCPD